MTEIGEIHPSQGSEHKKAREKRGRRYEQHFKSREFRAQGDPKHPAASQYVRRAPGHAKTVWECHGGYDQVMLSFMPRAGSRPHSTCRTFGMPGVVDTSRTRTSRARPWVECAGRHTRPSWKVDATPPPCRSPTPLPQPLFVRQRVSLLSLSLSLSLALSLSLSLRIEGPQQSMLGEWEGERELV